MTDTTKILAATAGIAAATGIAMAVGKKFKDNRANGSAPAVVLHVRAGDDGSWRVQSDDAGVADAPHSTKGRAVRAARKLAHSRKPSRLVIHRGDGAVQREHTYRRRA